MTANPFNRIIVNVETQGSTKILGSHWTECWQLKKVYAKSSALAFTHQAFTSRVFAKFRITYSLGLLRDWYEKCKKSKSDANLYTIGYDRVT